MFFLNLCIFSPAEEMMWALILHRKENKLRSRKSVLSSSMNRNDLYKFTMDDFDAGEMWCCIPWKSFDRKGTQRTQLPS